MNDHHRVVSILAVALTSFVLSSTVYAQDDASNLELPQGLAPEIQKTLHHDVYGFYERGKGRAKDAWMSANNRQQDLTIRVDERGLKLADRSEQNSDLPVDAIPDWRWRMTLTAMGAEVDPRDNIEYPSEDEGYDDVEDTLNDTDDLLGEPSQTTEVYLPVMRGQ